jgi:hypothetical protein
MPQRPEHAAAITGEKGAGNLPPHNRQRLQPFLQQAARQSNGETANLPALPIARVQA